MLKQHGSKRERGWNGPILFSYGFRPFFLFAGVFALLAIALWLAQLSGYNVILADLAPRDWHRHEMLFGYAPAVIAGFLFTAVPNWTGRFPVVGWPLAALFGLWALGRLAMLAPLPYSVAAPIDAAFLPLLALIIGREIVAGNNWRNLKVLVPIGVLGGANIWFHMALLSGGSADAPVRLAFASILLLIMLIGGRVIPSFTRNWLARQPKGAMPITFNRLDGGVIAFSAATLLGWVVLGASPAMAAPLALVGVGHLVRQLRWAPLRCLPNPLLLVLHVAYVTLPLGFLMLAAAAAFDAPTLNTAALHIFGIGTVAGMTISVMTRATLGHTGRALATDGAINAMLILLATSLVFRVIGAIWPADGWAVTLSGSAWILGFGLFVFHVGPWLLRPRVPPKKGVPPKL